MNTLTVTKDLVHLQADLRDRLRRRGFAATLSFTADKVTLTTSAPVDILRAEKLRTAATEMVAASR